MKENNNIYRKKIKILFGILNENLKGGLPTHLPLLKEELEKFTLLKTFNYSRKKDDETFLQKIYKRLFDLFVINRDINEFRPDLVHHNSAFDKIAILRDAPLVFLLKRKNIKIFIKIHGSFDEMFNSLKFPLNRIRDFVLTNIDGLGVLSAEEKNEFEKRWPYLRNKIFVVKNIIDDIFFDQIRVEDNDPYILFISRLIKKKGPFDILKAAPIVLKEYPNSKFVFIGGGEDSNEFKNKILNHEFKENIVYYPHLPNKELIKFYKKAWMFVFPTYFPEGMPMVVSQALAMGVPIITTKTRFALSYMKENIHCLFLNNHSSDEIAEKIIYLIKNKSLREKISRNNKKLSEKFKKEKVTRDFLEIYYKIIK